MVDFSIVISAYNEEKRLPRTLERNLAYMRKRPESFEILIVNNGSHDGTGTFVESFSKQNREVRMISQYPNLGRGLGIRKGILDAKGEIILETDADNSVDCEAMGRCLDAFKADPELMFIFGSREMKASVITKHQPFLRVFLGKGFILLMHCVLGMWKVHDFTLGFKMFRRVAAQDIFRHQYDSRFFAEAEIVFVAHKRKWKYMELPITWTDDRDSRVRPFRDSARSLWGMIRVLGHYFQGKY